MDIQPRFEKLAKKKLMGKCLEMSYAQNKTQQLWTSFMTQYMQLPTLPSKEFYSIQIYPPQFFEQFDPTMAFEKWAAVELADVDTIPEGFTALTLPEGDYAVFDYKGPSNDPTVFQYIFGSWLPTSGYQLAGRPHFELLGEKYINNSPNSEEEIWIPIERL